MLSIDPRAVMWSAPESAREDRPLLVLLHGRGADEGDLFALTPLLPLEPVIASVRAPIADGAGHSWFDPDERPGYFSAEGADAAVAALLAWLDTVDTSNGVGLLGFSQGAVVAAQALRVQPRRFDYAVLLSGCVVRDDHDGDVRLRELPPPAFWGRGAEDFVIPPPSVEWSIPWLATHTVLSEHVYPDLGHAVSAQELRDIHAFVEARLAA